MGEKIISKIIGTLTGDDSLLDWWIGEEINIPFFEGEKVGISFTDYDPETDETFLEEADEALKHFLALKTTDREAVSHLVYKNCLDFLDTIEPDEADADLRSITHENEIWKFVQPTEIYVTRRLYEDENIYIQVACSCDWEQEHGLQLVFRQGKKLTRISGQDGHLTDADAYGKPDSEDLLLSQF
ncbi:DUF6985 domain-containing protein [Pedobacter cryoconitis]|uniref:DUF6985 domain-containing protein n=1 Tax=Pedobacter cryoconitis TaxID=188932 RepID=A0A7X0MHD0_9SPHI|nr:hypothetical protein [Pedobacter cryoconitis]MBB6499247.1 hypothetical protein [Pedobacter cryoconitis]